MKHIDTFMVDIRGMELWGTEPDILDEVVLPPDWQEKYPSLDETSYRIFAAGYAPDSGVTFGEWNIMSVTIFRPISRDAVSYQFLALFSIGGDFSPVLISNLRSLHEYMCRYVPLANHAVGVIDVVGRREDEKNRHDFLGRL